MHVFLRASLTAAVVAGLALVPAPVSTQAPPANSAASAPYQDLSLDFEARAKDLVGRLTLDEKIAQLMNDAPAIPRLGVPAYNWWNEALHGVARAGTATVFPQAIGMAASFDTALMTRVATAIGDEGRAKHHEFVRRGDTRHLPRPDLLVAEHQHLPRPALGPRPGDLRRGSVPDGADGRRLRQGAAGRRSEVLEDGGDGEALRRPQRPGGGSPHLRRQPERARPLRDLPAGFPVAGARGQGGVRDGRLQPRLRRVGVGQPSISGPDPAQGLGFRRLRRVRLRIHRRHLRGPQDREDSPRRPRRWR